MSNIKLSYDDKKKLVMGIVAALCIVVIVLGGLALAELVKIFVASNKTYGSAFIQKLPGDDRDLTLSEDESVFFAYTFQNVAFKSTEKEGVYSFSKDLEKLNYDPDNKDYVVLLNLHNYFAQKYKNVLESHVTMNLNLPDKTTTDIDFDVRFTFYPNTTKFTLVCDEKAVGYINAIVLDGFNIRLIERPKAADVLISSSALQAQTKNNHFEYTFNAASCTKNGEFGGAFDPYYLVKEHDNNDFSVCVDSNSARQSHAFYGMIYRTGTEAFKPAKDTILDRYYGNNSIYLPGMQSGANYKMTFTLPDGTVKTSTFNFLDRGTAKNLIPISSVQQREIEQRRYNFEDTKPAGSGGQVADDGTYKAPLTDVYEVYVYENDTYEYKFDGKFKGAFKYTLETDYGNYDTVINLNFWASKADYFGLVVGMYLVDPIDPSNSAILNQIVQAMSAISFDISMEY